SINYLSEDSEVSVPKREVDSNKGSNGRVVVIGGSEKYLGALMLAVRGATKTGAGYIIAFVLEKFNTALKVFAPDVVSIPVPSGERGYFSKEDADFILGSGIIRKDDVVVIGNGITTQESTRDFFEKLVMGLDNILVIDADGINILSERPNFWGSLPNKDRIVLTPHVGEFARLVKAEVSEVRGRAFLFGREFSRTFGVNLVLKDNVNYVFFSDGEIWISDLNTPVLARAGTGDILAGLVGGNIAFTKSLKKGVTLGVKMLGELARRWGEDGFYPTPLEILSGE
ncbi:MAG: NAD(P)H-hydrate dehydratase, partial [Brevinematia bacterium]